METLGSPTDAELVARVLEADREAFAIVYDRYGPRLYDFSYSMLRQPEDAADAVADSFVIFAERLPQLRDPDRLRPWLYAVVRSECLRRLKARKRFSYGDDEVLVAMPDDSLTPDEVAEKAALTQLVWDAAAGLADRDRALLDLHLRQGLEGAELGEAMGVSASNAYVMLNRLRAQVDRSLGALLIARLGREECAELDAMLVDWNGSFSPLIRKRVARHVDGCGICGERRKKILSPWMLLAGVPLFATPAALRDRVLQDTRLVAYTGPGAGGGGTAGPGSGGTHAARRWRNRTAIAAAAVLLIGAAATTVAVWPQDDSAPIATQPAPTVPAPTGPVGTPGTTLSPADPSTAATTAATTDGPTDEPTATDSPTAAAGDQPASLTLSDADIQLGKVGTSASVRIGNAGDLPLTYAVSSDRSWLSAGPAAGTMDGGDSVKLTVKGVRSSLAEGSYTGHLRITGNGGSATVTVSLVVANPPVVGLPGVGRRPSCTVPTTVAVTDDSGVRSVRLHWSGAGGSGSVAMTLSGGTWHGTMGPFDQGGDVTFYATAVDTHGNTTRGPTRVQNIDPCPG